MSGTGCWIGSHYAGCLSYADDLTLLCPTATGLQKLVDICEQYAKDYGMSFNPLKSVCILFSRGKYNMDTVPQIKLEGEILSWKQYVKHLGNYISHDLSETKDIAMKRSDIFGRVNTVIGNLTGVSPNIVSKVFTAKCCHFYGTQIWDFTQGSLRDFTVAWNRCVRRLLCLPNKTHCRFLVYLIDSQDPHDRICNTFIRQVICMKNSENQLVKHIAIRGKNSETIIGKNSNYISQHYGMHTKDILKSTVSLERCTSEDLCTIRAIKDIINGNVKFTELECAMFVNYLCTN